METNRKHSWYFQNSGYARARVLYPTCSWNRQFQEGSLGLTQRQVSQVLVISEALISLTLMAKHLLIAAGRSCLFLLVSRVPVPRRPNIYLEYALFSRLQLSPGTAKSRYYVQFRPRGSNLTTVFVPSSHPPAKHKTPSTQWEKVCF